MSADEFPQAAETSSTASKEPDPWLAFRRHTDARIALGRSGVSLLTREVLAFGLAHAQARDAVHVALDTVSLRTQLQADGWPAVEVRSRAADRAAYLARPDWGRRLHQESASLLRAAATATPDIVIVVSDGLSSTAVQHNALPLLQSIRSALPESRLAPIVIATQARVALADEVGAILGARIAVSIIGERPGLSSPDSLGIYLTYAPRVGRNDGERNCISNIRPAGLAYGEAAAQLAVLVRASMATCISGVALRFDPSALPLHPVDR